MAVGGFQVGRAAGGVGELDTGWAPSRTGIPKFEHETPLGCLLSAQSKPHPGD